MRALPLYTIIRKIRQVEKKESVDLIIKIMRNRQERKVFLAFISTEAALAGLPSILSGINIKWLNGEVGLFFLMDDNAGWITPLLALIIAIGYYLYLNSNKPTRTEVCEIRDKIDFINDQFNFVPSMHWFKEKNDAAIDSLGVRYSQVINFPFPDMKWALASFRDDDGFRPLMSEEIREFRKAIRDFLRDIKSAEEIAAKCDHILEAIKGLDGTLEAYTRVKKELSSFQEETMNYYYEVLLDKSRSNYFYQKLRDAGVNLEKSLSNKWIEHKGKKPVIITGPAGVGKSHLLADMVVKRHAVKEPSILLLGQHFTDMSDPLSQIITFLDVKCKKETFLSRLDNYGKRNDVNVVIFIDAINEGAGEDYWRRFLDILVSDINNHEHLRLVISYRSSDRRNWFHDLAQDNRFSTYMHQGFRGYEHEAYKYIFSSFKLDQPLWPAYREEFSNPLFLIKYCRTHEKSGKPLLLDDFWTTILAYCNVTNHDLAVKHKYDDHLTLVSDALRKIAQLIVQRKRRYGLKLRDVLKALPDVARYTKNPMEFFDVLIDEGLLRMDIYGGETYVSYGFERIGDYFIAEHLINNHPDVDWFDYRWGDLAEAFAILTPTIKGTELFSIVDDENYDYAIDAFIRNSAWRNSFTKEGCDCIRRLLDDKDFETVFEIILSRPFRDDPIANASALYDILWDMSMIERDSIWTVRISRDELGYNIQKLAKWVSGADVNSISSLSGLAANLCAETMVWALTATNKEIRDCATHSLVNLFVGKPALSLEILEKYHKINDPYVQERLWCAVYGAILILSDDKRIGQVANWTYKNIFVQKLVPDNILTRNHLVNIVLYGKHRNEVTGIDETLIKGPFRNHPLPKELPSTDHITTKYETNRRWDSIPEEEKEEYSAKNRILSSMAVEHNKRSTMYGDFGRYVFQYNVSPYGYDPELLSNWAIEMIFDDFGYNPKTFAVFDNLSAVSYDRFHTSIERIGKKYQWIAMYRIMALLQDEHPDLDFSDDFRWPSIDARNIDPTMFPGRRYEKGESKHELPVFDMTKPEDDVKWLNLWREMPDIREYLIYKDNEGVEWLNLFSYNTLKHTPDDINAPQRDLWTYIQGYATDKRNIKKICSLLHKHGLQGRSFHENRETYGLFAREFYWSKEFWQIVPDTYLSRPFIINHKEFSNLLIAPAYLQYQRDSATDASSDEGVSMLMPNKWIFDAMGLRFDSGLGKWVNEEDTMIVVDNFLYSGGHEALMVRLDAMLEYLKKNDKVLFWPILTERQIMGDGLSYALHAQSGGWAYIDCNGKIRYRFKCYEPTAIQKKINKLRLSVDKIKARMKISLIKHRIIKPTLEQRLEMLSFTEELEYDEEEQQGT